MTDFVEFLAPYRLHDVLSASDVHIAVALARLAGVTQPEVVLAVALAARAPRHGDVFVDIASIEQQLTVELDAVDSDAVDQLDPLPAWPAPSTWVEHVAASTLVTATNAPLVLHGSHLYLERYHEYEVAVADQLLARATIASDVVAASTQHIDHVLAVLLSGDGADRQRDAVRSALTSRLTVLIGGPGTGKTTTVAALLAVLLHGDPSLRVALVAPTGKAAARLGEALRHAAVRLPHEQAQRLFAAETSTIHRLLGARGSSGFRYHVGHLLRYDVVIVDETSMVSLPLMSRLLDAVAPDARLVLVGDPGQLASVEAGSVLADIAGPFADPTTSAKRPISGALGSRVASLEFSRRFPPGSPLDRFARAVRLGDADAALALMQQPQLGLDGALDWQPVAADQPVAVEVIRTLAVPAALAVHAKALAGDASAALSELESMRVLCAHRHGPFGVDRWNARIEAWMTASGVTTRGWYVGRPVLVTANDYRRQLFNGDVGVVVAGEPADLVAFAAGDQPRLLRPSQLDAIETVHAMTIHKSQGSEFDHVVVVLPPADSPLATRELLYTAVTRARQRVTVVGDEQAVRAAIARRTQRSSGLRSRLWQ